MLLEGTKAPDFTLDDQDGKSISLSDFAGQNILLWFYPKASTPGWTIEGQELRDEFHNFKDKNTVILGMSADSVKSQKNFCEKQKFPFSLVSDQIKVRLESMRLLEWKKCTEENMKGFLEFLI